jgi:hypothetical protein
MKKDILSWMERRAIVDDYRPATRQVEKLEHPHDPTSLKHFVSERSVASHSYTDCSILEYDIAFVNPVLQLRINFGFQCDTLLGDLVLSIWD